MSHKRIPVPAICIFLAATILVLGCGNSTPRSDNVTTSFTQAIKDYFGEYYNLTKRSDAMSVWSVGLDYAHKGEYDKAIAKFNKSLELNPEDAIVYYFRGNCYANKGEYDKAVADYTKAIEMDPELKVIEREYLVSRAYYEHGLAHKSKGEYDEAASDFEKVIQMATRYPELVENARQALADIRK
jgi:tetratricopeptide (TPR) repeat protein